MSERPTKAMETEYLSVKVERMKRLSGKYCSCSGRRNHCGLGEGVPRRRSPATPAAGYARPPPPHALTETPPLHDTP